MSTANTGRELLLTASIIWSNGGRKGGLKLNPNNASTTRENLFFKLAGSLITVSLR